MAPIGVASTHSGVKVPTIRYYEEIGLLPALPSTESNRRRDDPATSAALSSSAMRASTSRRFPFSLSH
jgi:hypothetical protein